VSLKTWPHLCLRLAAVTELPKSRIFICLPPAIARRRAIQWASGLSFLSSDSIALVVLWEAPTIA
jgi:hypothetical protein